jgi:nicotinamide-nucleotide amidase
VSETPEYAEAAAVHGLLRAAGATVATAESLTGGMLAQVLTAVPGASASYVGGVVTYATELKESLLGVPAAVVEQDGVISAACASAMAEGVRRLTGAGWGLATTGVAGPDRQEGHPPGTVFVGVAGPGSVQARELALSGSREEIRRATCAEVLATLRAILGSEESAVG